MSKYNLSDLHEGSIIKEMMSRGGTVTDSFYSIANNADEIEGQNIGKDTYPIEIKRLGPSSDGKTNEEILVRYGSDLKDYFSIYDYRFGEDPTSEDNFDQEYPFSLGVPTGKGRETLTWAKKLGFEVDEMSENKSFIATHIDEMYIDEDQDEISDKVKEIKPLFPDVDDTVLIDFVKTHIDDIRGADDDDIKFEYSEFLANNYEGPSDFPDVNEDLKAHFNRFI